MGEKKNVEVDGSHGRSKKIKNKKSSMRRFQELLENVAETDKRRNAHRKLGEGSSDAQNQKK